MMLVPELVPGGDMLWKLDHPIAVLAEENALGVVPGT